jgi:hypothetical protein
LSPNSIDFFRGNRKRLDGVLIDLGEKSIKLAIFFINPVADPVACCVLGENSAMNSVSRFLLLVFLFSCSVGDSDGDPGLEQYYNVQGPGYRFTVDTGQYQRLDFNRKDPSLCQVSFEIKSISRKGNELSLTIERPKGCDGIYELVWDGIWQESSPRRMQLYLTGLFTACAGGTETDLDVIKVDLAKALLGAPGDLFTIYLREHCSFRDFNCVGNCDLSV